MGNKTKDKLSINIHITDKNTVRGEVNNCMWLKTKRMIGRVFYMIYAANFCK